MMTQPHSPEPWRVEKRGSEGWYYSIVDALGKEVIQVAGSDPAHKWGDAGTLDISEADAHRVVACVNACAGMSDDELKRRA
jgi:hypothetical protein